MIYLSLAELGLIALICYGSWNASRAQNRAHARREDLLLNQALHAAGKPWQPAPADEHTPLPIYDEDGELMVASRYAFFTDTPEQEP